MPFDWRYVAIVFAATAAFFNLWSVQPMLPLLAGEFNASVAQAGLLMTAATLSVALTAPFTGALADVLGRKRVIVTAIFLMVIPTVAISYAPNLTAIMACRFAQGLLMPPIFAVTVAYIGDEWPAKGITRVTAIYVAGGVCGGFAGRAVSGFMTDLVGWRDAILFDAGITALLALIVLLFLPREKQFVRATSFGSSVGQMLQHLKNPALVATCAVGFGIMFLFVGGFTYIAFYLAAPPFNLSPTALGAIYFTHMFGMLVVNIAGPGVARFGRRNFTAVVFVVWIFAFTVTLAPSLVAIIAGLAVGSACGMIAQAVSQGFVVSNAQQGRSSAIGLYVLCYYSGGSVGALLPALVWDKGGWPATVAMLIIALAGVCALVWFTWDRPRVRPA